VIAAPHFQCIPAPAPGELRKKIHGILKVERHSARYEAVIRHKETIKLILILQGTTALYIIAKWQPIKKEKSF
jgi:predicted FMN-binding regulatory protein PaiB